MNRQAPISTGSQGPGPNTCERLSSPWRMSDARSSGPFPTAYPFPPRIAARHNRPWELSGRQWCDKMRFITRWRRGHVPCNRRCLGAHSGYYARCMRTERARPAGCRRYAGGDAGRTGHRAAPDDGSAYPYSGQHAYAHPHQYPAANTHFYAYTNSENHPTNEQLRWGRIPCVVARRKQDRIHIKPRRGQRNLRDERRRLRCHPSHRQLGLGRKPCVVARRKQDRVHIQPRRGR